MSTLCYSGSSYFEIELGKARVDMGLSTDTVLEHVFEMEFLCKHKYRCCQIMSLARKRGTEPKPIIA